MTDLPAIPATVSGGVADRRAALEARHPVWMPRTTAQTLDLVAAEHPARSLVLGDDHDHTYAEIAAWSGRLAAGLVSVGVRPGGHVAVDMANGPEVVALKFAVARLGAVSVSINFLLRHEELAYVLGQSGARVLITMDHFRGLDYLDALDRIAPGWDTREDRAGGGTLPALERVFVLGTDGPPARGRTLDDLVALGADVADDEIQARTAAADPFATSDLLYTSGTTGTAKGVMLQHDAVLRTAYACAYTRAFGDGRRMLYALPIYHVFGYIEGLVAALFVGGAGAPHASFDAGRTLRDIARHRIDELICVPAMTSVVLAAARAGDHDLSSLRTMFSSGGAHPPHLWAEMYEVLGVDEIFTAYGQTETTASATCTQPGDPLERLMGTNGCLKPAGVAGEPELGGVLAVYKAIHPETGETLPVGETGELVCRGPIITRGYHDKPEETAALFTAEGWMRTGDLGRIDEHGYLVLTGRLKESYRCGGELVMPGEVERILGEHPDVEAAHVVGVPHERMGEVGCAWVVPGARRPTPEELVEHCTGRLARFKVPAAVLFTDAADLPMTVTGRVRKFVLVERALAALAAARTIAPQPRSGEPSGDDATGPRVVIVGGGLAAVRTAQTLRDLGHTGPIRVLSAESEAPYDRPPLSKDYLAGDRSEESLHLMPAGTYLERDIRLDLGSEVVGLDRGTRTVTVADGTVVPYDRLVIATGARARSLPVFEGVAAATPLRTAGDARRLGAVLARRGAVVVVGGGFIGLEVAATARTRGCDVTVVEAQEAPLLAALGPEAAAWLRTAHESRGVGFRCGVVVTAAESTPDGAADLVLSDGTTLHADAVVVGVGVDRHVPWVADAGLEVADPHGGGLVCDDDGRTADPHVFGAGDVVCHRGVDGDRPVAHWTAAGTTARRVAHALLDRDVPNLPDDAFFWSDQFDMRVQCVGTASGCEEFRVVSGDLAAGAFVAHYVRDGRTTGVLGVNDPRTFVRHRIELRRSEQDREVVA